MKNRFTIGDFLELEKEVDTKIHYKDACGAGVIQLDSQDEITINQIKDFFKRKNIEIEFSNDNKYVFTK
ncbi:RDAC family protein [Caviibacter abscessus]|uniref:RDAC family protein n=1 Tax=Caviibacter abscessus TaxID=1766719 RepID=UPI00082FBAB0|nr:hypothetical protein [Caviibacter abscessus]